MNYETAEKIVKSGDSKIFNEWSKETGITTEEFLDGLKWLYQDSGIEVDENGKRFRPLERELGCEYGRGIVRLKRVNDRAGTHFIEESSGESWQTTWRMTEEGTLRIKNTSISAGDRI